MKEALKLALKGGDWTHPNPRVGAVIVKGGTIVGRGYHRRFGEAHAEVNALKIAGKRASGATLYVTLEPCSHQGKTPPCTAAIISSGIKRVVIATRDTNPLVAGKGIKSLKSKGIEVNEGVLKEVAIGQNKEFHFAHLHRIPFLALKSALTLDGMIADRRGDSKWIAGKDSRIYAHHLRARYDAILVGRTTVSRDDPELTVRHVKGRNPIRIVLDPECALSLSRKVFDTRKAPTILCVKSSSVRKHEKKILEAKNRGVTILFLKDFSSGSLRDLLKKLYALGVTSILIEGGGRTASSFLDSDVVQRFHLFIAPMMLGKGIPLFQRQKSLYISAPESWSLTFTRQFEDDLYVEWEANR